MLRAFENWLKFEKRFSKHTVVSYLNDLNQFQIFISENYDHLEIEKVNTQVIKAWVVSLMEKKYSTRSVNRKIVSLNTFYKFLQREGILQDNPVKSIQGPKQPQRIVKYLEEYEINDLLENFEFDNDFNGFRDKMIFELLYGTGVRLSELIELKIGNIDLNSLNLKVLGKRNKERIIPINSSLEQELKKYLKIRTAEFGINQNEPLLLTEKGKPLYPMLVYRVVKKYLDEQSSRINVSPHVLRHSFATHLINKGADINAIKELLGHANLAATQIYTHNTIERLKEVFKQAHPRGEDDK